MSKLRTILLVAGVTLLLAGGAVFPLLSRRQIPVAAQSGGKAPPAVDVVEAEIRPMGRAVRLSGTLKSGSEASLAAKLGGRILEVAVAEGQAVRRGQVLVRLDPADPSRQAEQAAGGAAAARATWQKAEAAVGLKRLDVERRINEARRGVKQAKLQVRKAEAGSRLQTGTAQADVERAQAGLDAARSELAKAKRGARPEQRRAAQIQLEGANRGVIQAKKNLEDVEYLYNKGGLTRLQLDDAREGYQKALDGQAQARAQLEGLEAGATPEEIAAAEAGVRSAEAALNAAKVGAGRLEVDRVDIAAAREQLRLVEDGLRAAIGARAEVALVERDAAAARGVYEQALAGSRLASAQIAETALKSPVDGIATSVSAHAGELAAPGRPLMTIVGTAGVYLEAAAPARTLADVRQGQDAVVTLDALPDRPFRGTVRSVDTVAGADGRSFPVRIDLAAPAGALRPGAAARAELRSVAYPAAVTVPVGALRSEGDRTLVWLVRGGRLVEVPVRSPLQNAKRAVVEGDVRAGDRVVVSAEAGLHPGETVQARPATWD